MPHHSAASPSHPYDYYYRPGTPLRPPPPRAVVSELWDRPRKNNTVLGRRFTALPNETELIRLFADHMWQGDEPMDAVVDCFRRLSAGHGRKLLNHALDHGIDAVPDAPAELQALFEHLDNPPIPYQPERWEHGRQVWISSSFAGKFGMVVQDSFGTFVGTEVSSAVGATGRFVTNPNRRFFESNTWFRNVTYAGAMERFSPVFKDTVRVRLMHAQVRAGLRRSWGDEHFGQHGNPISSATMMGAAASFGLLPLIVDYIHGRRRPAQEFDAALYYWGYIAQIFGVADELIPRDVDAALDIMDYMAATAGGPTESTAVIADHATASFAERTPYGVAKRALAAPVLGLAACYVGEPLVRALIRTTPLRDVPLGIWPQVTDALVRVNVLWCAAVDQLPGRHWRWRAKARHGDPFWRLLTEVARIGAARHGITSTPYDHHDATAETANGCPIVSG